MFPTPHKWRACTGLDVTSHSGKVSIFFGGDNFLSFPEEVERDQWSVGLYKSKLSGKFVIYRSVNSSTITWFKTVNYLNTVCVKSISILDLQEQLLLSVSAEKCSDPTNREKLNKEKGIKEILANTAVDKFNNKVSVKCFYKEDKVPNLGENYYGVLTSSWPTKPCASLILYQIPIATINKISCITINPLTDTITEYLERTGSYTMVLNAMCFLSKVNRAYKHYSALIPPWNNVQNYISSSIIS